MLDSAFRLNAALRGRYRIERKLGEGGMATVYLAEDIRHQRRVALKVLRPELAAVVGADRFLAEIKTTANLQHPHILPLFDSGEADGFLFYVMPYVEGETLRDRLDREKQLPVDEALGITTAVANALQTAHDHGVVHRDIKPGNILLSRGEPLVADFGIALAVGAGGGNRLTETGLSLGTPYYMSPEQATGDQVVGPPTDTYALGCVLYEMLIGEPPYSGSTAQAVLGKIIQGTPVSARSTRPAVPRHVDAAIRKALEKLPADRFKSPRDFARALGDPAFRHGADTERAVGAGGRKGRMLAVAACALSAVLGAFLGATLTQPDAVPSVTRVAMEFSEGQAPAGVGRFDMSADGTLLVYQGSREGGRQLWARRWDALEAVPIPDTERATGTFAVSPDGAEVAFTLLNALRVVAIEGGIGRTLAADSVRCCPRWSADGAWIYFSDFSQGLSRVPARGGQVEAVTRPDPELTADFDAWVDALPDGDAIVYESSALGGDAAPRVLATRVGSEQVTELAEGRYPRYSGGYLLFTSPDSRTLLAAPFDADRLTLTGPARPVVDGLRPHFSGWNFFAAAQSGKLLYATSQGVATGADQELVWATKEGELSSAGWSFDGPDGNPAVRLSPSGASVALVATTDGNADVWVKELLPERPPRRLTLAEGAEIAPWWAADSRTVFYISPEPNLDVWSVRADGTGEPTLFLDADGDLRHGDWSRDGRHLVLRTAARAGGAIDQPDRDLLVFQPGEDTQPRPLVATAQFAENQPAISPDGRWIAYASTETGSYEIWVRSFPNVDSVEVRVSTGGGVQPRWSPDGRELFFISPNRELIAATLEYQPALRVITIERLFPLADEVLFGLGGDTYDVGPDGRFLMVRNLTSAQDSRHILVLNALEHLRAPR